MTLSLRFVAVCILCIVSMTLTFLTYGQGLNKDIAFELLPPTGPVLKGQEISIGVRMNNPTKQNITSFLQVLQYDNKLLRGLRVEPAPNSLFDIDLYSSDETAFLQDKGIARMGRATIAEVGPLSDGPMLLGQFVFQVLEQPSTPLTFQLLHNSPLSTESTSAYITNGDVIENILNADALKVLTVGSTGVQQTTSPAPIQTTPPRPSTSTEEVPAMGGGGFATLAPQEGVTGEVLEKVPSTPQNGPMQQIFFLALFSIASTILFTRFSHNRI